MPGSKWPAKPQVDLFENISSPSSGIACLSEHGPYGDDPDRLVLDGDPVRENPSLGRDRRFPAGVGRPKVPSPGALDPRPSARPNIAAVTTGNRKPPAAERRVFSPSFPEDISSVSGTVSVRGAAPHLTKVTVTPGRAAATFA